MAAIDTLTGVTKINEFLYEVTQNVNVGSGLMTLKWLFRQQGQHFQFGSGRTITKCEFTEEENAGARGR